MKNPNPNPPISSFVTGVKKLIYIHKFPESGGNKQPGKANSLADLGTDLLALVETDKPNSAPVSPKPMTPKPAPPSTQDAEKKHPMQDDTTSLTELEKQAEMEVNFLTKKKDKGMVCFVGRAVTSWLVGSTPDRAVRVRDLAGDIVLCSWARHLTLTVPLSTQVYKWVPANLMLGVTLRWTSIPSRGEKKYS